MNSRSLLTLALLIFTIAAKSQTFSPAQSTEVCPGINYTFTCSLPGSALTSVTAKALNVNPTVVSQPTNVTVSGGTLSFTFVGRFTDNNNKQSFLISYKNAQGVSSTYDLTYSKIKSLVNPNQCSEIKPTTSSIQAPRCQISSFNITFPNVTYGNPYEATQPFCYGSITNYEYLLPPGWSLGGTVSNGSNWIAGGSNVTVTSDRSSGDGTTIKIRAVNNCAAGLAPGQATSISVFRQAPSLSITGTQFYICDNSSATFSMGGMPTGATIQWSLSNTSVAAITSGANSSTVTVAKVGTSNTVITLSAVVSHCDFIYPKSVEVTLGKPAPNPITEVLVDATVGKIQVESSPAIPGSSYRWYKDGVLVTNQYGFAATIPIARGVCGVGYGIEAAALNGCGTSTRTYKGVYVPCTASAYTASPNPASSQITVSPKDGQNSSEKAIEELRVYDHQGNLKMVQKYGKVRTATLNIARLPSGNYFLEITSGIYKEKLQLLVQK